MCFYVMCLDNFKTDPVLQTLFVPKTKAIKRVWQASENYVTEWLFNTQYYFYCVALLYIICLCLSLCLVWRINVFISSGSETVVVFAWTGQLNGGVPLKDVDVFYYRHVSRRSIL